MRFGSAVTSVRGNLLIPSHVASPPAGRTKCPELIGGLCRWAVSATTEKCHEWRLRLHEPFDTSVLYHGHMYASHVTNYHSLWFIERA